jgi:hypothetical protein
MERDRLSVPVLLQIHHPFASCINPLKSSSILKLTPMVRTPHTTVQFGTPFLTQLTQTLAETSPIERRLDPNLARSGDVSPRWCSYRQHRAPSRGTAASELAIPLLAKSPSSVGDDNVRLVKIDWRRRTHNAYSIQYRSISRPCTLTGRPSRFPRPSLAVSSSPNP